MLSVQAAFLHNLRGSEKKLENHYIYFLAPIYIKYLTEIDFLFLKEYIPVSAARQGLRIRE